MTVKSYIFDGLHKITEWLKKFAFKAFEVDFFYVSEVVEHDEEKKCENVFFWIP